MENKKEATAQEIIDFVNKQTLDESKRCRILLGEVLLRLEQVERKLNSKE